MALARGSSWRWSIENTIIPQMVQSQLHAWEVERSHGTKFRHHAKPSQSIPWTKDATNRDDEKGAKNIGVGYGNICMVFSSVKSSHNIIFIDDYLLI